MGVKLRDPKNPGKSYALEVLLCTLTHELAHHWDSNHSLLFFRKWRHFMEEVEMDLGGKIRLFEPSSDVHKYQLSWL